MVRDKKILLEHPSAEMAVIAQPSCAVKVRFSFFRVFSTVHTIEPICRFHSYSSF